MLTNAPTVKLTVRLWPSTSASQIVSVLLTMTHMEQGSSQANGQSPMHTLLSPMFEHVQQRNRLNPCLHPRPLPHHSPCLCRSPCLLPQCTCPYTIIPIPHCPSQCIPIIREPLWLPFIIPPLCLTHSHHHKCN